MKVKDLIFELEDLDPNLEVYFDITEAVKDNYILDIVEWVSEETIFIGDEREPRKVALIKSKWPD